MAKGYVQPITRKQALSYERVIPNGIGVTTLAAVNGRGAAARARANAAAKADDSYRSRYAATKAALHGYARNEGAEVGVSASGGTKPNRGVDMEFHDNPRKRGAAFKRTAQYKAMQAGLKAYLAGKGKKGKKAKKAAKKRRKAAGPKFDAWKSIKVGHGKKAKRVPLLKAKVGRKSFRTYLIPGKGGRVRHVPEWMYFGFGSQAEYANLHKKAEAGDEKALKRYNATRKRVERLSARRDRAAAAAAKRIALHGDMFTPNAMTYEEWSKSMTPNKRKKAGKKASKKSSRRGKGKRQLRGAAFKRTKQYKAMQAGLARYLAGKGKKRKGGKKKAAKRTAAKSTVRRSAAKRKVSRRKGGRRELLSIHFRANKRHHRRHYHRNAGMQSIKELLISGLAVTAGFAAHRALRHVLDEKGLAKIDALNTEKVVGYRTMIASAATVLVGVGALQFVKGKQSAMAQKALTEVQGGMIASVVLDLLTQTLAKYDSTKNAVPYLSGFGEYVPMSGFGEYVPMSGLGSYYTMSGMGEFVGSQAAAGFGAMAQAQNRLRLTQAASGFGAITGQAAAGVPLSQYFEPGREHRLTQVVPISGFGSDGLMPNLSAAERALTVAEAAAGFGADGHGPDVTSTQSIVDAWQVDQDITDPDSAASRNYGSLSPFVSETLQDISDISDYAEEQGLRTGVLAGGNFG